MTATAEPKWNETASFIPNTRVPMSLLEPTLSSAQANSTSASLGASPAAHGGYISVHGLKMYYQIHGSGQPLVLLHGALTTIES